MADQRPPMPPTPGPRQWSPPPRRRHTALIIGIVVGVAVLALVVSSAILVGTLFNTQDTASSQAPTSHRSTQVPDSSPTPAPSFTDTGLEDNILYNGELGHDLTQSACPSLDAYRPGGSDQQNKAAVQALVACLDSLHAPMLTPDGVEVTIPEIVFYEDTLSGACSADITAETLAGYCLADGTMYFSLPALRAGQMLSEHPLGLFHLTSHEYAHYLQDAVGISSQVGSSTTESRQTELQANCLAGAFINASWTHSGATDALLADVHELFDDMYGDQPPGQGTHGTPETTGVWFDKGVADQGTSSYSDCNTFAAPNSEVR